MKCLKKLDHVFQPQLRQKLRIVFPSPVMFTLVQIVLQASFFHA